MKELDDCRAKVRYLSEREALKQARSRMRADLSAPDLEVYECRWCRCWHLTSSRPDRHRRRARL